MNDRRPALADVHFNADEQQLKSDSKFVCHSSVLTLSMYRYYESLFVGCSSTISMVVPGPVTLDWRRWHQTAGLIHYTSVDGPPHRLG